MFNIFYRFIKPKPSKFESKLKYLKAINHDIYKSNLVFKKQLFIEDTIEEYIDVISKYNSIDISTSKIDVKTIIGDKILYKTYSKWLNPNDTIIYNGNELIQKWLNVIEIFYNTVNIGLTNRTNPIYNTNARKLHPYLINIENIVSDLVSLYR